MRKHIFWLCFLGGVFGIVVFLIWSNFPDEINQLINNSTSEEKIKISDSSEVIYWQEQIREVGGKEAYQKFAEEFGLDTDKGIQHENAHFFGEALYKELGIPGVSVCDQNFAFGCYHSFFGWALLENGLSVLPDLDQACIDVYGRKGLGCQHGLGHGVLIELGYDQLERSLNECMKLDWQEPIGGCTSGVFMEYNFHTMGETGRRQLEVGGEHYPCSVVPDRFEEACYFEQPAWWTMLSDKDYKYVGQHCEEAPSVKGKEACYRGVGNVAAGVLNYSLIDIANSCQLMPNPEGEILCIEGAAWIMSAQEEFDNTWDKLCEPYGGEYYRRCMESYEFI